MPPDCYLHVTRLNPMLVCLGDTRLLGVLQMAGLPPTVQFHGLYLCYSGEPASCNLPTKTPLHTTENLGT